MVNLQFFQSIGITLFFSVVTAFYYYHQRGKRDISIAVILYSLFVFCIVYFVSFEGNIGLGIGLIGILSLIRLRSTPENLIDIGFVFYAISIGLLNASIENLSDMLVVNVILAAVMFFMASGIVFKNDSITTEIILDEIESEKLGDTQALMKKVENKFGITPLKIKVMNINYLKDSITIKVTYNAKTH